MAACAAAPEMAATAPAARRRRENMACVGQRGESTPRLRPRTAPRWVTAADAGTQCQCQAGLCNAASWPSHRLSAKHSRCVLGHLPTFPLRFALHVPRPPQHALLLHPAQPQKHAHGTQVHAVVWETGRIRACGRATRTGRQRRAIASASRVGAAG